MSMDVQKRDWLSQNAAHYGSVIALGLASASLGPTLAGLADNTGTHLSQLGTLPNAMRIPSPRG